LEVHRDRAGRFQTDLFERYGRSEKALVLSFMNMYVSPEGSVNQLTWRKVLLHITVDLIDG